MLVLPDAVRDTSPADVLQSNGYCSDTSPAGVLILEGTPNSGTIPTNY